MSIFYPRYSFLWLLLFMPAVVSAKDVASEQYSVSAAQEQYDTAKAEHENAIQRVKDQEKRVSQEQARLKELLKKQAVAKAALDQARAHLAHQQKALDRAWQSGGR
jgi:hypothetical protein